MTWAILQGGAPWAWLYPAVLQITQAHPTWLPPPASPAPSHPPSLVGCPLRGPGSGVAEGARAAAAKLTFLSLPAIVLGSCGCASALAPTAPGLGGAMTHFLSSQ